MGRKQTLIYQQNLLTWSAPWKKRLDATSTSLWTLMVLHKLESSTDGTHSWMSHSRPALWRCCATNQNDDSSTFELAMAGSDPTTCAWMARIESICLALGSFHSKWSQCVTWGGKIKLPILVHTYVSNVMEKIVEVTILSE